MWYWRDWKNTIRNGTQSRVSNMSDFYNYDNALADAAIIVTIILKKGEGKSFNTSSLFTSPRRFPKMKTILAEKICPDRPLDLPKGLFGGPYSIANLPNQYLNSITKSVYHDPLQKWIHRLKLCISSQWGLFWEHEIKKCVITYILNLPCPHMQPKVHLHSLSHLSYLPKMLWQNNKQCSPWLNWSFRSRLIRVYTVCLGPSVWIFSVFSV